MVFNWFFISFFQEYRAGKEAEKLSEMVRATATVYRMVNHGK
jgi:magnesium-transporting ATPase (P-type)